MLERVDLARAERGRRLSYQLESARAKKKVTRGRRAPAGVGARYVDRGQARAASRMYEAKYREHERGDVVDTPVARAVRGDEADEQADAPVEHALAALRGRRGCRWQRAPQSCARQLRASQKWLVQISAAAPDVNSGAALCFR